MRYTCFVLFLTTYLFSCTNNANSEISEENLKKDESESLSSVVVEGDAVGSEEEVALVLDEGLTLDKFDRNAIYQIDELVGAIESPWWDYEGTLVLTGIVGNLFSNRLNPWVEFHDNLVDGNNLIYVRKVDAEDAIVDVDGIVTLKVDYKYKLALASIDDPNQKKMSIESGRRITDTGPLITEVPNPENYANENLDAAAFHKEVMGWHGVEATYRGYFDTKTKSTTDYGVTWNLSLSSESGGSFNNQGVRLNCTLADDIDGEAIETGQELTIRGTVSLSNDKISIIDAVIIE
ncbi:MAG: hypothetical protein VX611_00335 [Bacteroidota bacterium]|nr:hypothetical protein [Bacteroidota bacterium]MEC8032543.1 hypothetical protein [Bacteroidota bacterium]MEC8757674.1 hypothetical protein [Bacteroidota bacterium]MEC9221078.1 hypothetical protein [Bacteroidota bacterium]